MLPPAPVREKTVSSLIWAAASSLVYSGSLLGSRVSLTLSWAGCPEAHFAGRMSHGGKSSSTSEQKTQPAPSRENVKCSLGSVQRPDLWEIKVGNTPLLRNQNLLALRSRQPRFPQLEKPSITAEGEWLPACPRLGRGPGYVCKHLHLGCTCQARTDLEATERTCSSDFPSFICSGDGPAELCTSLHPSFPPAWGWRSPA